MAAERGYPSQAGRFYLRVKNPSAAPPLNQMHSWTVHVDDRDGGAVTGAVISIIGGMPDHDHGLPTAPRMTTELGAGDYLIEGMKFHMSGAWLLTFTITAGGSSDRVIVAKTL
jgi:hypothetical protein